MTKTEPLFTENGLDIIVGAFLEELETADNRDAVVWKYQEAYPQIATLIRELAAQEDILDTIHPGPESEYPKTLPDFHIERELGRGGMGVVFEAVQESLERRVALKVQRANMRTKEALKVFRREQRVLAKLHQTNIVPIHFAGQYGPWHYFAMTYVQGASLHQIVKHIRQLVQRGVTKTPTLAEAVHQQLELRKSEPDTEPIPAEPIIARDTPAPTGLPSLSKEYFVSVASNLMLVAEAVHYAHCAGVVHRDLKPGNIIIDADGQPRLIDFGLARRQAYESDTVPDVAAPEGAPVAGDDPQTQGLSGTPQYIAPERWENPGADPEPHSDTWALGAILYELLTLQRAYDGSNFLEVMLKIREEEPAPIDSLVKNVPVDLVKIYEKAMHRNPAERYPSAQALADDLRRWVQWEPVEARGPDFVREWVRRPYLWVLRNWQLALAMFGVFVMLAVAAGFWIRSANQKKELAEKDKTAATVAAETREREAQREVDAADERARESQKLAQEQKRTVKIQSLERQRLVEKELGWSEKAWGTMKELTKLGSDTKLRDQAAALLIGYDANPPKTLPQPISFATAALAWDPKGDRLLMGGNSRQPAQFWDGAKGVVKSQQVGLGPVTFTKDGRPLQLVEANSGLLVWDADKNQSVCELDLPDKGKGKWAAPVLSEDGSRAAAITGAADGKTSIVTWDATSGKLLKQWERDTTQIALTPDGVFLAAGSKDGTVTVFAVPDGKEVATLRGTRRSEVSALAFGRNVVRPRDGTGPLGNWLLAVGDMGASVVIWNPELKVPVSYCDGSSHHIFTLAFSPDGVTLASAGRTAVNLWDIATGKPVLRLSVPEYHHALAFSSDGAKLAVSRTQGNLVTHEVHVFQFQNGRGLTSLRGLVGEIANVTFSPDGTRVAAVSHRFDTAVWEWPSGRLLHVFDTPKGIWADNLTVAISHDNKRLAYSAHNCAVMYDLTTGKELQTWALPAGLVELMAFDKTDTKLMLFRAETDDSKVTPDGSADPRKYPRVCRLRNLLGADPLEPVAAFKDFDWHVFESVMATDASVVVVGGISTARGKGERVVKAINGTTGEELWKRTIERKNPGQSFALDPSGTILFLAIDDSGERQLMEIRTQKFIGVLRGNAGGGLSVGAKYWGNRKDSGFGIGRLTETDPLLLLGLDLPVTTVFPKFHPKNLQVVWGVRDGTVIVADIPRVKEKLKELKLDW